MLQIMKTKPQAITGACSRLAFVVSACCFRLSARAQNYSIPWYKVAGGGGTSTGGTYPVSGTIGQPDAGGAMSGGNYSLTGGFWSLISVVQTAGAAHSDHRAVGQQRHCLLAGHGQLHIATEQQPGHTGGLDDKRLHHQHQQRHQQHHHHAAHGQFVFPAWPVTSFLISKTEPGTPLTGRAGKRRVLVLSGPIEFQSKSSGPV